jgi:hypothetical protein
MRASTALLLTTSRETVLKLAAIRLIEIASTVVETRI